MRELKDVRGVLKNILEFVRLVTNSNFVPTIAVWNTAIKLEFRNSDHRIILMIAEHLKLLMDKAVWVKDFRISVNINGIEELDKTKRDTAEGEFYLKTESFNLVFFQKDGEPINFSREGNIHFYPLDYINLD